MSPAIEEGQAETSFSPVEIFLDGCPEAVRSALAELLSALAPLALDIEETSSIELVLAEALNNIVEHAYQAGAETTGGPIQISCTHHADGLHLRILDRGRAMPSGIPPLGQAQPTAVAIADLPESGFGWFLIKDLAKDVRYRRIGEQNQLDLRLAVGLPLPH